ncbi:MAG: DUF4199 domain-containing protein [Bacteroidota bacterium]
MIETVNNNDPLIKKTIEETEVSIPKVALIAGFIIYLLLTLSFLIMKYFQVIHFPALRFANIFILVIGLIFTFIYYRSKTNILNIAYLEGLWLGMLTTLLSCAAFGIFIFIYFHFVDSPALQELEGNTIMMGHSLTASAAALSSIVEGLCIGGITSFIIMQYYKSGFYKTRQERNNDISKF